MSGNKTSTQPPDRIIDIDGLPILAPTGYDDTLQAGLKMIDHMEACNVDRSDMQVAINNLMSELLFHLHFLPKRRSQLRKDAERAVYIQSIGRQELTNDKKSKVVKMLLQEYGMTFEDIAGLTGLSVDYVRRLSQITAFQPPTPTSGEPPCSSSDNPNHEPANPTPNPKD